MGISNPFAYRRCLSRSRLVYFQPKRAEQREKEGERRKKGQKRPRNMKYVRGRHPFPISLEVHLTNRPAGSVGLRKLVQVNKKLVQIQWRTQNVFYLLFANDCQIQHFI